MSIALYDYQQDLQDRIFQAWADGHRNVCAVAPVGAGKTIIMASTAQRFGGSVCAIAHRQELVGQISLAFAQAGVRHGIIAPQSVIRTICQIHKLELGRHYFDPSSNIRVAGVGTLVRMSPDDRWLHQVALWMQDEAHHLVRQTQWAKAAEMMPNARGLGVTATPVRGDGKGLGRHADGIMDTMVVGPSLRDLIARGRLTDYRIFAPPAAALDLTVVPTSASGDYSPEPLRKAVHKAHLTGDVVKHYLRHCAGKRGVTFAVDIEAAAELARAYRDAGVPAECVSGKTPDLLRAQILHRFRTGELLQLTNCDLFGEGFNLPAIECVSMARPTQSFGLFVQQAGRALRTLEGKTQATIIDHVGNVQRHAVARFDPHAGKPVVDLCHRSWTLDRRERKSSSKAADGIPTRACPQCTQVYERAMPACPYCGHSPEPAARNDPILVDGDLTELDASTLRGMMSQVQRVDGMPLIPHGAPPEVEGAVRKRHRERQEAQRELRESMALWGGGHRVGQERRSQREFFLKFGTDVLTAQTLGAREARELTERVKRDMQ